MRELTKTKLNKILKQYRVKLEKFNNEWDQVCKNARLREDLPSIYEHEHHNAKGAKLFKDLMAEFDNYEVFVKTPTTHETTD